MNNEAKTFTQQNFSNDDFLQSPEWMKFQESVGRKTYNLTSPASPDKEGGYFGFCANIIEHNLPIAGKYFYIPRGPIVPRSIKHETWNKNLEELVDLARKNNAGWIRIEPENEEALGIIKNSVKNKIVKAPHDMQPKELFIIDITKPEDQILTEMKSKTRYNIKVAQRHGVKVKIISRLDSGSEAGMTKYIDSFINLTRVTAKRNGIVSHEKSYYKKMFETIPGNMLKLYVAEYEGKIIAANLVVFYGKIGIYLHGASDDQYRNVMAPFLLQWQQIKDAKVAGCTQYDFGGVKTSGKGQATSNKERMTSDNGSWAGITRFKLGFSPETRPTKFPGCYDIIINKKKYWLYLIFSRLMPVMKKIKGR